MPEFYPNFGIELPCPSYVRKYMQARYELKPGAKWRPLRSDRIGKFFINLLERAPDRMEKYKPFEDFLPIEISNDYGLRKGYWLSQEGIDDFNRFIRLELIEEVARYENNLRLEIGKKKYDKVFMRKSANASANIIPMDKIVIHQLFEKKEIMYDFLATFGITEDDFSYESLKKATYRLKLHSLSA